MVINRVCGNENSKTRNIGGKKQCTEAPVKTFALAKDSFSFASEADANNKEKWLEAIKNKDIVPLPNVEGREPNNTEAQIKNGLYKDYELSEGVSGSKYRLDLSICTYDALKTYKNSKYTRVFQITEAEEVTGDFQADGSLKGRKMTSFLIGLRNEHTGGDVPFVDILVKYGNDVYSIIKPNFEASALEGIFDVALTLVSATPSSIKFKANTTCSNSSVTSFEYANFKVRDAEGAVQTVGSNPINSDGIYEITGAFSNNYSIELDGVIAQTEIIYEGIAPLKITGI